MDITRIGFFDHPQNVFSPEAVVAWGDLETMLEFIAEQPPTSNSRYRYGLVRESALQPIWIPTDAGLVDHLFLLFGLVESLDPNFFRDRMFPALNAGDFNADGLVDAADYDLWRSTFGSTTRLAADGNKDNVVDAADYVIWRKAFVATGGNSALAVVPEPNAAALLFFAAALASTTRRWPRACLDRASRVGVSLLASR